ncbi:hypothetical protein GCM10023231_26030 [Olivibacter ginsenosidimutans]|uniref:S1/P1 Nuclease n=2 Tax=Olivibacter ginsenosidimutans TaxID=1176537 RepID=A0ABP9BJ46_9SPHI
MYATYLTEHAVDPDKRRYITEYEAARHYIDADAYGKHPFDSIPKTWKAAVAKYTEDTLMSRGIVPWQIARSYDQLIKAFQTKDLPKILRHSADLGHYIADAHVPLHTTHNYNGQLTNQVGIHAFWESRLPELFAQHYDFLVGSAQYIDHPLLEAWHMVEQSFSQVDSVLEIEASLSKTYPQEKKFAYENRLRTIDKVYSRAYSTDYHRLLGGMVEQQMKKAVIAVGSYWYSAWVDAGQPDLKGLLKPDQPLATDVQADSSYYDKKALGREEWQ